jgi:predicted PurR-regulated permease PerM
VDARGVALTGLLVLAGLVTLQWARPLLVPILLAILISYALDPIVQRLVKWGAPLTLAAVLVFVGAVTATGMVAYSISYQVVVLTDRLPVAAQELREALQTRTTGAPGPVAKVQQAAEELQKIAGTDPLAPRGRSATVAIARKPFDVSDYLWTSSVSVTTFVGDLIVVLFLTLYLLLAGDLFRRRFVEIAGPTLSRKKITVEILNAIALQISRYLFVRMLISLFVAAGTWLAFWAIGLAQPGAWGVAAGLLNVIPYFGSASLAGTAAVAAYLQFHSVMMVSLTAGLGILVACIEGYVVTPWLMSRTAEMNPAAVFIGLLFWAWLWGLPGLFLAVPILMVTKAICDQVESLQPIALLLKR